MNPEQKQAFDTAFDNYLAGQDVDSTLTDCAKFMFNAGVTHGAKNQARTIETALGTAKVLSDGKAQPDEPIYIVGKGWQCDDMPPAGTNLYTEAPAVAVKCPSDVCEFEIQNEALRKVNAQMLAALKSCDWNSLDLPEFVRVEVEAAIAAAEAQMKEQL